MGRVKYDVSKAMPAKVPKTRMFEKAAIIQSYFENKSFVKLAKLFGRDRTTIAAIWKRYVQEQTLDRKRRCGKNRKTSKEEDEKIIKIVEDDRSITSNEIIKKVGPQ